MSSVLYHLIKTFIFLYPIYNMTRAHACVRMRLRVNKDLLIIRILLFKYYFYLKNIHVISFKLNYNIKYKLRSSLRGYILSEYIRYTKYIL